MQGSPRSKRRIDELILSLLSKFLLLSFVSGYIEYGSQLESRTLRIETGLLVVKCCTVDEYSTK